jgi:undecaprenyl-diphosphatase
VVVVYYKKFFDFTRLSFYIKLIIAMIPAVVFGILLKKHIDKALENLYFIAIVMIGGGIIFLFVDNWFNQPDGFESERHVSNGAAFRIGCFQVLSILLPGFSRSGATIIGGMSQGLTRKAAAEFSFFLAVPTMLAASVKSLWDVHKEHPDVLSKDNATLLLISGIVTFLRVHHCHPVLYRLSAKAWVQGLGLLPDRRRAGDAVPCCGGVSYDRDGVQKSDQWLGHV